MREVVVGGDAVGRVQPTVSVDSTVVRAHQHAAGARHTREAQKGEYQVNTGTPGDRPDPAVRGEVGRCRGGLISKIRLAGDGWGRPLSIVLTAGNVNDCTRFDEVLAGIRIPRSGPGRPRTRPDHVLADKGYSTKAICASLRQRGIAHTIPERDDQKNNRRRKGSAGGRPPAFDPTGYKARNVVERCFNQLKQFRDLATRYTKRGHYYRAEVVLASLMIWLAA